MVVKSGSSHPKAAAFRKAQATVRARTKAVKQARAMGAGAGVKIIRDEAGAITGFQATKSIQQARQLQEIKARQVAEAKIKAEQVKVQQQQEQIKKQTSEQELQMAAAEKMFGGVAYEPVAKKGIIERVRAKALKLEFKSQFGTQREKMIAPALGVGVFGLSAVKGFVTPFIHPIETAKGFYQTIRHPVKTTKLLFKEAMVSPAATSGELFGLGKGIGAISKVPSVVRRTGVKAGARFVPPEQVFDVGVLEGKQTFPTSKSIKETVQRFEATKGEVAHAGPTPIGRRPEIKPGPMGAKLFEDPGLFVTPKGEASPHFLGLTKSDIPGYELTLLPKIPRPTLIEVGLRGVKRQPESVLKQPGFEPSAEFLSGQAGKGFAFITKRHEAAFRKLPLKKGGATTEIEAVIPVGTKLIPAPPKTFLGRIKGFEEYTVIEGEAVPIRKFEPTSEVISKKEFSQVAKGIRKQQQSFSSFVEGKSTKKIVLSEKLPVRPSRAKPSVSELISPYRSKPSRRTSEVTSPYELSYVKPSRVSDIFRPYREPSRGTSRTIPSRVSPRRITERPRPLKPSRYVPPTRLYRPPLPPIVPPIPPIRYERKEKTFELVFKEPTRKKETD